jgi:hypothetical protein
MEFNGTSNFLDGNKPTSLNGATFTVSCWFLWRAGGATASTGSGGKVAYPLVTRCVGEADGSNVDGNYFMGIDSTTLSLCGDYEDTGTGLNHPVTGATAIKTNIWYHGAITYDGSTFKVYLNGVQDATLSVTNTPRSDSIQQFCVGSTLNSANAVSGFWRGYISEVAFWNVGLQAGEVARLTNHVKYTPLSVRSSSLKGYWPLDDAPNGVTVVNGLRSVRDWSGQNNHLDPTNSPIGRAEGILSYP